MPLTPRLFGAVLVARLHQRLHEPGAGQRRPRRRARFRAGGYLGEFVAGQLSDYLSRTGSIIVILTLLFVAVILSTQFSFGRLFSAIFRVVAGLVGFGLDARDRVGAGAAPARERRDVIAKHVKKGTAPEVVKAAVERVAGRRATRVGATGDKSPAEERDEDDDRRRRRHAPPRARARALTPPVVQKRAREHRSRPRCRCPLPSR